LPQNKAGYNKRSMSKITVESLLKISEECFKTPDQNYVIDAYFTPPADFGYCEIRNTGTYSKHLHRAIDLPGAVKWLNENKYN